MNKRFKLNWSHHYLFNYLGGDFSYYNIMMCFLPKNLKYIVTCEKSNLNLLDLYRVKLKSNTLKVPTLFSLIENSDASYSFIKDVAAALLFREYDMIYIDFNDCTSIGLEAQVFLDIIVKEAFIFSKRCSKYKKIRIPKLTIRGVNANQDEVKKMLFSVGSPVVHSNNSIDFPDIIPYKLCIHNSKSNHPNTMGMKDVHTTDLADYVINSLDRLNISLTPEKLEDLCIVISETLINAEEHSSTNYRFSIGYFTDITSEGKHFGVFRLVIMNFGQTIYEKFKDPMCPNKHSVNRMDEMSEMYNKKKFFIFNKFEEETLWTVYSLQEGITSTDPALYQKRGNGSIRFIESFFNIKGTTKNLDDISQMTLVSGKTQVGFDGTYHIVDEKRNNDNYQYMTFNKSGSIMNKPDEEFVKFVPNYFPGTYICAEILLNEDDLSYAK